MINGRFYSYLNTAKSLIEDYEGELPFHHYIKQYFRENSKYGSRDRKQISAICYSYFRAGRAIISEDLEAKLRISYFLCADLPNDLLSFINESWNEKAGYNAAEKITLLGNSQIRISELFPFSSKLSRSIFAQQDLFLLSHLVQPELFLRMRPGREKTIEYKLSKAGIRYAVSGCAIELPNNTDISSIIDTDREGVVQDRSSQQTGRFIAQAALAIPKRMKGPIVWDCCAGSGGKSLLALDVIGNMELTVTDIRKSILENLQERLNKAGVKTYRSMVADLSVPIKGLAPMYDMVIADVPCSGSGTWGRTPEEMHFFTAAKLADFCTLQKKIIDNTIPSLLPGAQFLYFTCSVYEDENEKAVNYLIDRYGYRLNMAENIMGFEKKADTMFAAWLTSPA